MGKKKIPDHRAKAYDGSYYRPTEEDVLLLGRRYQFKLDYPLREALENAYSKEATNRHIAESTPTLGEQKKQLRVLRERCEKVEEVVSKLGSHERMLLDQVLHDSPNLRLFEKDTHRLCFASQVVLEELNDQRDAREKDNAIWSFVWCLADIWEIGTGTRPTAGFNEMSGQYVGNFYEFVLQCANMGNIWLSKADPGGIIVKILCEWRTKKITVSL